MKPVVIIAIAFVLLVPGIVFAQSSSQENNCPVGTKPVVKGTTIECVKTTNIQRTCPDGTYQGRDNQGNFACRDIATNQIVDPNTGLMYDSQTGELIENEQSAIIFGVIFLVIIIGAIIAYASRKKSAPESYKDVERKHFTFSTKEKVKEIQEGKCNICGRYPNHWEFDHINGRGDNSIENCQGLCRDCHQSKTLDDNEKHRD